MNIEKITKEIVAHRAEIQTAIAEAKDEVPHLVNAAGHLASALRNLEGHVAAAAEKKAEAEKAAAKPVAATK